MQKHIYTALRGQVLSLTCRLFFTQQSVTICQPWAPKCADRTSATGWGRGLWSQMEFSSAKTWITKFLTKIPLAFSTLESVFLRCLNLILHSLTDALRFSIFLFILLFAAGAVNPVSAVTVCIRQNLTSVEFRFWRMKRCLHWKK